MKHARDPLYRRHRLPAEVIWVCLTFHADWITQSPQKRSASRNRTAGPAEMRFLVDPQRDCYGSSGEVNRLAADIDDAIDNQVGVLSKLDRIGSAACSRLFAASVSAA